jgi:hypothetical protein
MILVNDSSINPIILELLSNTTSIAENYIDPIITNLWDWENTNSLVDSIGGVGFAGSGSLTYSTDHYIHSLNAGFDRTGDYFAVNTNYLITSVKMTSTMGSDLGGLFRRTPYEYNLSYKTSSATHTIYTDSGSVNPTAWGNIGTSQNTLLFFYSRPHKLVRFFKKIHGTDTNLNYISEYSLPDIITYQSGAKFTHFNHGTSGQLLTYNIKLARL